MNNESIKDDFWQRVDEFYTKYPGQHEAEQTWEYWCGIEDFLDQLLQDVTHQAKGECNAQADS